MTADSGDRAKHAPAADPIEFIVRRLAKIRADEGSVPAEMMRFAADTAGVDVRTMSRYVKAGTRVRKPRPKTELSPQLRGLHFELNGSVSRVLRHCAQHEIDCPPRETLRRIINRELTAAERAYAKHGEHARRAATVYLKTADSHRNAVWEADHKNLGVLVVPPHGNAKPVEPPNMNRPGVHGDFWPWKIKDGVHAFRANSRQADDQAVFG